MMDRHEKHKVTVGVRVRGQKEEFLEQLRKTPIIQLAEVNKALREKYGRLILDGITDIKLPEVTIVPTEEEQAERTRQIFGRYARFQEEHRPLPLDESWTRWAREWVKGWLK